MREEQTIREAYKGLKFIEIMQNDNINSSPAAPCHATPHSFFRNTYQMHVVGEERQRSGYQVFHRHHNGLIIVTAGPQELNNGLFLERDIQQVAKVSSIAGESTNTKRKVLTKMLAGKKINDGIAVTPTDILFRIGDQNFCAGVFGIILEINENLTSSLLLKDPLLDGYLAVILPAGPFPPPEPSPPA